MFAEVLGWVAAIIGSSFSIPQIHRILTARTTAGLSLLMWQFMVTSGICWTTHGFLIGKPNVIAPNMFSLLCSLVVLVMIRRHRSMGFLTVWALPLAVAAVMIAVDFGWGPLVFGLGMAIPQVIGMGAQAVDIMRSLDLSGVSPVSMTLSLLIQGLWCVWGISVGEMAVIASSFLTGMSALVTLGWYLMRRLRIVGPIPVGRYRVRPDEEPPIQVAP